MFHLKKNTTFKSTLQSVFRFCTYVQNLNELSLIEKQQRRIHGRDTPPPLKCFFYFVKFWQHNTHIFSLKSTHNVYNIYITLYSHYRNMGMCEGPQTPRNLPRPCFRYRKLSTCISVHIEWLSNRAFWVRKPKMSRKYSSFRLMIFPYSFLNNDFIYHVFTGSMS